MSVNILRYLTTLGRIIPNDDYDDDDDQDEEEEEEKEDDV